MQITDLNKKQLSTGKLILYYTIVFAIIAAGVFSVFIIFGKSFIQYGDGYRQGYFWTAEFKHVLSSIFSGNGLPQWSWSRGLGMQYMFRVDPFNLLAALFPIKYLELGITISLVLKLYCGGLAYFAFARDLKMSNFQCIMGPVCYIFSTWFINVTMIQSSFIFISFMLPLLMMSIDRIYRGKSPILFIAVVAYFLIRDTYLSYMAAIVAVLFMLLRYFAYNEKFEAGKYFKQVGMFVVYGLTAGLISAAFSLQFALATFRASMESTNNSLPDLFSSSSFFFGFIRTLMTAGLTHGYTYIGLPILALLVLPLAIKRISLKNTSSLMTVILLAMTFFPFFSRMFNGFGYSTGRWFVMIVFFASWATMECFDIEKLRSKSNMRILIIWLAVIAVCTLGFDFIGLIGLSLRGKAFILLNILAGAAILIVIGAFKTPKINIGHRQLATLCIAGLTLMVCWSMSFYLYQDKFINVGEVADSLEKSTQRASAQIDDDGFYRIDQVDWLNCNQSMEMPVNENLWWQAKTIYVYDSFTSSKQLEFNKLVGNNYGYLMRVYVLSNDNRMGLDFLYGVKYFLGDDPANGKTGSDEYAGYGFSYMDNIDGVNVFRNKYDSGLGFAYDAYISESEYLKLSRTEREQALLQAVVIPDKDCSKISTARELKASDIETDVSEIGYDIVEYDGVDIEDGKIITYKEDASITLRLDEPVEESQLIVSLDNFVKDDDHSFSITCEDGKIREIVHTGHSNQCLPDIRDFDMNMGYQKNFTGDLKITFNHESVYTYDRLYVSAMAVDNYDKYAQERLDEKYEIEDYDNHHVSGTVDADEDGILYFSIPQYTNWDVYVDGKKAEKLTDINIAFMGVEIEKGTHDVELKYNNVSLKYGIGVSVLGLIIAVIIGLAYRRRHKENYS